MTVKWFTDEISTCSELTVDQLLIGEGGMWVGPFGIDGVKPNCWNCCWSGSMFGVMLKGMGC